MSLSARRLGMELGLTAEEMNFLLKEEGFLDGSPNDYYLTEKGKKYALEKYDGNGYGGYAARSWSWLEWDESIIDKLNVTDDRKREIREKTAEQRRRRREERNARSEEYWRNVNNKNQESAPVQSTENSDDKIKDTLIKGGIALAGWGIYQLYKFFFEDKET